jgi:hypothetical protein
LRQLFDESYDDDDDDDDDGGGGCERGQKPKQPDHIQETVILHKRTI